MRIPAWYARHYPSRKDLEDHADRLGALVLYIPELPAGAIVFMKPPARHVICIPAGLGPLDEIWQLAHEVAHLVLHGGYISEWQHDRQEHQADIWAARALIPTAAMHRHRNASEDAFIAALSSHYEDIPLVDCPQRRLAAEIATIRLSTMEVME